MLRRTALLVTVGLLGAVPVALAVSAEPFGAPEVADPGWWHYPGATGVLGADAHGNAYWASFARDEEGGEQPAVFARCGATAASWKPTLLGTPHPNFALVGMRVARNGTAMVVWSTSDGQGSTFHSATKPPGGAWGTPQTVVSDPDVNAVQFALSDAGDAVAAWTDTSPASTRISIRPAGGSWGAPEPVVGEARAHRVAMSATGDVIVLTRIFAKLESFFRPAGGTFGPGQIAVESPYPDTLQAMLVEFDGLGRAVMAAEYREFNDTVYLNVRSGGAWGNPALRFDDDGDNPPNPLFDLRGLQRLIRHKSGAVAVWTRQSTTSNFNGDIVVVRLGAGGWEPTAKIFDIPTALYDPAVAANDAGEILVAGTLSYRPPGAGSDVTEVHGAIAPSISGAWPEMTRISPEASSAGEYRGEGTAAASGNTFYLGWGVHGSANRRSEVVATGPAACGGGTATPTPTPTPTPTASAAPSPQPQPIVEPQPQPTPTPRVAKPTAIADFTTLPAASKCVKGRKLTLRLKRPPKGYTVKSVAVKVNGKRVATLRGKALKKPFHLRRLPKRTFTVAVTITPTKGKALTERRRYRACR